MRMVAGENEGPGIVVSSQVWGGRPWSGSETVVMQHTSRSDAYLPHRLLLLFFFFLTKSHHEHKTGMLGSFFTHQPSNFPDGCSKMARNKIKVKTPVVKLHPKHLIKCYYYHTRVHASSVMLLKTRL